MESKNQLGEIGFMLTQLEVAINFIDKADKKKFELEFFDKKILENEVNTGIHFHK